MTYVKVSGSVVIPDILVIGRVQTDFAIKGVAELIQRLRISVVAG